MLAARRVTMNIPGPFLILSALVLVAWFLAAGLLGDYMVSVYVLTALTLMGILRDWRRKGWDL